MPKESVLDVQNHIQRYFCPKTSKCEDIIHNIISYLAFLVGPGKNIISGGVFSTQCIKLPNPEKNWISLVYLGGGGQYCLPGCDMAFKLYCSSTCPQ